MKLRHYFPTLAALALVSATAQADDELPAVRPAEQIPIIKLPVEPTKNVVQYNAVAVRETPWHVSYVKAPESWAKNPAARGKGVKVAILDTGVQADHPGLGGAVKGLYNAITKQPNTATDGHGHGTHCAGIVHSIAPEADIYAVKVLGDDGSGAVDVIAHGIDYATNVLKVDVISMSLGGPTPDSYMPPAISNAIKSGVVVVCAAGNDGGPNDTEGYPGRYAESVSVAACDKNGKLASFSSWGPNVFTVDPGVDILSTLPGSKEGLMSGTSMATPCEAGKVASWIASNAIPKTADRRDLYRAAAKAASPFPARNNARGYGLYTLDKITGAAVQPPPVPPTPAPGGSVTLTLADLTADAQARLKAAGITSLSLTVGTGPAAAPPAQAPTPQPIPVQTIPPATEVRNPIPGRWQPPAPAWYPPLPQQVPLTMPGGCPGGVCPVPATQPGGWVPGQVIRRVLR